MCSPKKGSLFLFRLLYLSTKSVVTPGHDDVWVEGLEEKVQQCCRLELRTMEAWPPVEAWSEVLPDISYTSSSNRLHSKLRARPKSSSREG